MRTIVVGSRKSNLALTQTNWVIDQLKQFGLPFEFEIKKIVTKGDKILNVTLSKVGGKGLFVKEIEQALFDGTIDMAVHSMKDMPAVLPKGLTIACVPTRADHRDVLISKKFDSLASLPSGSVVGTSSLRRGAQILAKRPDLKVKPVRGNIETRIRKLEEGQFDAIILAAAGLERMGWTEELVTEYLQLEDCLPAVGQGALAIECRQDDLELIKLLRQLNDETTERTVAAERAFLHTLEGGCQVPIAAYAEMKDTNYIQLTGLVAEPDGKVVVTETMEGKEPVALGQALAKRLMERGAKTILDRVKEEFNNEN